MHRPSIAIQAAAVLAFCASAAVAQRYSGLSSPPTAPPLGQAKESHPLGPSPASPVSSGMGAIQFYPVNYGTQSPQTLTRQLSSTDERLRRAALAALGAPAQYTQRNSEPTVHSMQVEFLALGNNDDEDVLLTAELDHHVITAVLVPSGDEWRRVATLVLPTAFSDPTSTPSTFLTTKRSLLEPTRYRAVFHAREVQANGDYVENEAHLRIINGRPVITSSFATESKSCTQAAPGGRGAAAGPESCEFVHRWLQVDTINPGLRRFELVTGSGTLSGKDLQNPLADTHDFMMTRIRTFSCQPFTFSDASLHYEPTGPAGPCKKTPLTR